MTDWQHWVDWEREAENTQRTRCTELKPYDNPYEGCHVCFLEKGHAGKHYDPYSKHYWDGTEEGQELFLMAEREKAEREEVAREEAERRRRYPPLRLVE